MGNEMGEIKEALDTQQAICTQTFKRIEQSLGHIKEVVDEHRTHSNERTKQFNTVITDVEVIKTNLTNHLSHHTAIKQEFQWKTGLVIGVITFVVSMGVSVGFNIIRIKMSGG